MTNISKSILIKKEGWAAIPWRAIGIHVLKLQKRIYLASKEGDIRKVRKLQHTLVNSYDAKLLATRRVSQDNKGKKTPGVDGVKLIKAAQRFVFAKNVKIFTKGKPLRRVWIDKPGKAEKRPLGIPTLQDRAIQALFKSALEPEWEAKFEPNSYGFRPGRCTHDALRQIYACIKQQPKYVLDADISKCFDRIDHKKLLIKMGIKGNFATQIKSWLEAGVIDQDQHQETRFGTPQGGVISPLLANIALHGMENMLKDLMDTIPIRNGKDTRLMVSKDKRQSLSFIRYADDFVVMHFNRDVLLICQEAIKNWLSDIGLELSPEKTKITHTYILSDQDKQLFNLRTDCKPGFDFLGFTIRQFKSKYNCGRLKNSIKTFIIPSHETCKTYQTKLGLIINKSKVLSQELLIKRLNPVISGWARYFGRSDASTTKILSKMDYLLYLKLRKWSKRKTKSAKKGAHKYWRKVGNRNWTFGTYDGVNLVMNVDYEESIKFYVKVKGSNSPFDGKDIYWASRLGYSLAMSQSQAFLLKKQKGRCNLCGMLFKNEDMLETDHIIPISQGGGRGYQNIQLLHRHCHDQK